MPEQDSTSRYIDVHPNYEGSCFVAKVMLQPLNERGNAFKQPEQVGQYAFAHCSRVSVDHVHGELPDIPKPIIYIGSSFGKNYYTSHDHESVPVDVFEHLHENGYTLLTNVDGGWENWEGRNEFSENYIDYCDAEIVNLEDIIQEHRS